MNLLNSIQSQFTPQILNQIGGAVGASPEGARSALGAAVPATLASLAGKATTPTGASDLFNSLKQGQQSGGWFDSASGLSSGLSSGSFAPSSSGSLLNSLFGSRLGGVTDAIASHAGIGGGAAASILGIAAPLVMGSLGKHVASQGMGPSGLGQFLGSQTPYIRDAMPAGLSNTLGVSNLFKGGTEAPYEPAYGRTQETTYRTTTPRGPTEPAYSRPGAQPSGGRLLKWLWVPVLLALAAWLMAHRAHRRPALPATGAPGQYAQTAQGYQTGQRPTPPANPPANPPTTTTTLHLTPGSPAEKLSRSISSGELNKSFDLQGLNFDSAGNLAESSKGQVTELASVLKASPDLKVRITGYGPSQDDGLMRANAIRTALTADGISESRITTIGAMGTQTPSLNVMR